MNHLRPFGLENNPGWPVSTRAPDNYPQLKQHLMDTSSVQVGQFAYGQVLDTLGTTAFPPDTVARKWSGDVYGVSATVPASASPRSDIIAMPIDEGPVETRLSGKISSKMSIDHPSLTGACRKVSSRMSVDPSSPNVYQGPQRRTSSRMSVDAPSDYRRRGSSGRMLLDSPKHNNLWSSPKQARTLAPFTFPASPPTMGYFHVASTCTPQEYALKSGVGPLSFPTTTSRSRSPSHSAHTPYGETKLTPSSPPPSSSPRHTHRKDKLNVSPVTTALPLPYTSRSPASASVLPPPRADTATPPKVFSQKHETLASKRGSRQSPINQNAIYSPISKGCVRVRRSSSGDEVTHKRHCAQQHSPPAALLATDPRTACNPSPQPLSPIDEIQWLPPMEQQLESARQSQLKAKFRKFKVIIGGVVNDIKQVVVPYNKDHRKHKIARARSSPKPFAGVPDYLRAGSAERLDSRKHAGGPRYDRLTPCNVGKNVDDITGTWTDHPLCDSPTSLHGEDGVIHSNVPHLSLPLPKINEPARGTPGPCPAKIQSNDRVAMCAGTATTLTAPAIRRRTADAFGLPDSNVFYRKS